MSFHVERSLAPLVLGILVMFYCSHCVTAQSCSGYWTGPSCRFKCMCRTPMCNSNATCKSGGCEGVFFGTACQFYDIKEFGDSNDYTLVDSDEDTCLKAGTTTAKVHKKSGPLRFFRVVANNILGIKAFTFTPYQVTTVGSTMNKTPINCSDNRFYSVRTDNKFIRDFYCFVKEDVVSMIEFSGEGVQYFCDVHISGGRNIGLKQTINATTVHNNTVKPENLVDGLAPDKIDLSTCYISADSNTRKQAVTVTLKDPVLVTYFRLFNYPEINLFHKFKDFSVETFNDKNEPVAKFTETSNKAIMIYVPGHSEPDRLVKYVRVSIPGPLLHFCEIEIYGECPKKKYGLDCTMDCSSLCLSSMCDLEGRCIGCSPGNWSNTCLKLCNEKCLNRVCDKDFGECTEGCVGQPKMFGPSCDRKCFRCYEDGSCNFKTGACKDGCIPGYIGENCSKECEPGFYGRNCANKCNDVCATNCTHSVGFCLSCPAGKFGKMCEVECPKNCLNKNCAPESGFCEDGCVQGFYSFNCTKECNKNCVGNECFQMNGSCSNGCQSGYYTHDCSKGEEERGKECSKNCADGECTPKNGTCTKGCVPRYYFHDCSKECSKQCGGTGICNSVDGSCLEGCSSGDENCSGNGEGGDLLPAACSPNCGGNKTCESASRQCLDGCILGKGGLDCNTDCSNCKDDTCVQLTLQCSAGCKAGYSGPTCADGSGLSTGTNEEGGAMFPALVGIILSLLFCLILLLLLRKKRVPEDAHVPE